MLPTINLFIVGSVLLIIFLIVIIIFIYIIYDVKKFNFTGDLLVIHLKLKEKNLKKRKFYVLLCKFLYVIRGQSVIYYHTRMYLFLLKYEFMKWYIYKYSLKNFIKEVIKFRFNRIDEILLSYYYRWLLNHDISEISEELNLIRIRENQIKVFLIKKIEKNRELTGNSENILRYKELENLVKKHKEYQELQEIKKLYKTRIEIHSGLMKKVKKKVNHLEFSNFYTRFSQIFFHYSFNLFWLLTTTSKLWLYKIKVKLVDPYIKNHSHYLIYQIQDDVSFRRKIEYQSEDTYKNMGHSKIMKPRYNWDINDVVRFKKPYIYHFRVNSYSDTKWYVNRDNQVWGHFSGKGTIQKDYRGLQVWDSYISRTHWGSDINWTEPMIPVKPLLYPYLSIYRYIGYPYGFLEYFTDLCFYYMDLVNYKLGKPVYHVFDVYTYYGEPLVVNFSLVFLLILFNIWCILTIILLSRKIQVFVKEKYFYIIFMFLFSSFYFFSIYLEYFDHNFILDSWIYILTLPFSNLKFNINNIEYLYIIWLHMIQ